MERIRFSPGPRARNGLLVMLVVLAAFRLATVPWHEVLISSVVELLPKAAGGEGAVAEAMREAQAGLVFFGGKEGALPPEVAQSLRAHLADLPGVKNAGVGFGPPSADALGRVLLEHRLALMFPTWLAEAQARYASLRPGLDFPEWLAEDAVGRLDAFLDAPDSLGLETLIETDPLLLLPSAFEAFEMPGADEGDAPDARVWLQLADDPLKTEVQEVMLPAILERVQAEEAAVEGLRIVWFGALRFAAESRAEMQREVSGLNVLTLLFVGLLATLVLRRPWQLMHLIVPVVVGLLGGLAVLTLVFERLHLLSLVLGSILAGVAIDFGVHLFFHSAERGSDRTVVRALLVSGLSTIIGYAVWASSSFILARQAGVFVATGLAFALIAVLLYTPFRKPAAPRFETLLRKELLPFGRLARYGLGSIAVVTIGVLGLKLKWDDRLEMLDIPHPELDEAVRMIAAQGAGGMDNRLVYAVGSSYIEAAEGIRKMDSRAIGLASFIPAPKAIEAVQAFAPQGEAFLGAWRRALEKKAFNRALFAGFEVPLLAYLGGDPEASITRAGTALTKVFEGPSSILIGSVDGMHWLGAMRSGLEGSEEPLPRGVFRLGVREELEDLIRTWRMEQVRLSILGMGVIGVIVFSFFPVRSSLLVLCLPLGSVGMTLSVLSWLMDGLNLFHLAGALLGFCVTLDYVVFYDHCRRAKEPFPASIRFSALTTMAAFGVLLLSQVEGVRSLGATVALGVLISILGLELMRPPPSKRGDV